MTIQYSTAVRNAMLDELETVTGTTAKLQIRTGAQPATCATAASGTLLAELTLPSDYLANAGSGAKAKSGTWSGLGVAAGTAAHFRLVDNAGTTCHAQGSVGAGSGDISLDNAVIAIGQTITISTFTITDGNP